MAEIPLAAAFLAGLAGFASPCVLPLIPSYLSYLAGLESPDPRKSSRIIASSFSFVLGLALALTALGFALGAVLDLISGETLLLAARVSGLMMILFGLYILGFVPHGFLEGRRGLILPEKASIPASFLMGALFAIVWTPVMGAFLAFVIFLAVSSPAEAPALLFAYALGLGLPFLIVGASASGASAFMKRHGRELNIFEKAMGLMVVIIGALIALGRFDIPGAD